MTELVFGWSALKLSDSRSGDILNTLAFYV